MSLEPDCLALHLVHSDISCDLEQNTLCLSFFHLQNGHISVKCPEQCLARKRYHIGLCSYYIGWFALYPLSHEVKGLTSTGTSSTAGPCLICPASPCLVSWRAQDP